jgi:diguanylate cyclase (GGDEF)-like protein
MTITGLIPRLLDHIAGLTGERKRPQLEARLVEALRDITAASNVTYFKLQTVHDEVLCWIAVTTDANTVSIHDDGVSLPARMVALSSQPDATEVLRSKVAVRNTTADGYRLTYPVASSGSAAGFLVLDYPQTPANAAAEIDTPLIIIEPLVRTFTNLMSLLDYSEVDTLTGLLNRKTFDEHLMQIIGSLITDDDDQIEADGVPRRRHAASAESSHWLAVIDIDHFKRINDNFGHLIGDEVLLMLANLMKSSFRFRDKLFRFGGEEFIVVIKPNTEVQALAIFDRFRQRIEKHIFPQVGQVTVSAGYAPIRLNNQPSVIIDHADEALYWVKSNGRNQTASYERLVEEGQISAYVPPASDMELF